MLSLDVLPEPQAIGLVREVLGTAHTVTEEEARELAQECGLLPLALRAAASFRLRRSSLTVAEYLAEVRSRGIAALDKVETVLGVLPALPTAQWCPASMLTRSASNRASDSLLQLAPGCCYPS